MDNQQFVGLSLFLAGAVIAPFVFIVGPICMIPGLIVLLLADRKKLPCKTCSVLFKASKRKCPSCGALRVT